MPVQKSEALQRRGETGRKNLEPMDLPMSTKGWPECFSTAFSISAMWLSTNFSAFGGGPRFPLAQSAVEFLIALWNDVSLVSPFASWMDNPTIDGAEKGINNMVTTKGLHG